MVSTSPQLKQLTAGRGGATGQQTDGLWDIRVLMTSQKTASRSSRILRYWAVILPVERYRRDRCFETDDFTLTVSSCGTGLRRKAAAEAPETFLTPAV